MNEADGSKDSRDREKHDEPGPRNRWGPGMGIEILEMSSARVTARIVTEERHHQPYGIVHGGVYCSIVEDIASQAAGIAARERGARGVVGVNNNTDFIRSHSAGELRAVAEPVHIGQSSMLWSVVITRADDGKLVARGQVRFHVLSELPDERRARLADEPPEAASCDGSASEASAAGGLRSPPGGES